MTEQTEPATVPEKKAYDLKVLGDRLKAKGLAHSEKAVGEMYVVMKEWAKESALISKNPWDDMTIPFYSQIDAVVLPQIDKISEEV